MSSFDSYGRDSSRRVSSRSPSHGGRRSRSYRRRSRSRDSSSSRSRHGRRRSRSPRAAHGSTRKRPLVNYDMSEDVSADDSDRDFDDDNLERTTSRAKKLKKINVEDPLSAFATKTKTRLGHIPASVFSKTKWNTIRGMDPETGKFLVKDRPKPDDWQKMAKSDSLINKWSGILPFLTQDLTMVFRLLFQK